MLIKHIEAPSEVDHGEVEPTQPKLTMRFKPLVDLTSNIHNLICLEKDEETELFDSKYLARYRSRKVFKPKVWLRPIKSIKKVNDDEEEDLEENELFNKKVSNAKKYVHHLQSRKSVMPSLRKQSYKDIVKILEEAKDDPSKRKRTIILPSL